MADPLENNLAFTNTELVSVIMPAYNAEKYISEAIHSVIQQTYTNWELIVVDDGSADRTAIIVKDLIAGNDRIKYLYQDNGGQGKARNNGLKHAEGEYIAFLDADDLWVPDKLLVQIRMMSGTRSDLIFCDAYVFEGKPGPEKRININPGYYRGEEAVHKFLFCNYIPVLTVLVKKSALEKVNGFSEAKEIQNAEDYHLWLRLLINANVFFGIDTPLAYYRIHRASATSGEGELLFPAFCCLRDIATRWPLYSPAINRSIYSLINDHLAKVNISRWDTAGRLLEIRNGLLKENVSVSFWKRVYFFFGKNIFRMLFSLKVKKNAGPAGDKKLKASFV